MMFDFIMTRVEGWGDEWYYYFAILGGIIIVSAIIISIWKKTSASMYALKVSKKVVKYLNKGLNSSNPKVSARMAENYMETVAYYFAQDDDTQDPSVLYDRREMATAVLKEIQSMNTGAEKKSKEEFYKAINEILPKIAQIQEMK